MNPESLIINALIIAESLSPYSARTVTQTWLNGSLSLDKPIRNSITERELTTTLGDFIPNDIPQPEALVIKKDSEEYLKGLIENSDLTEKQKQSILLRFFSGLKHREIADIMGLPRRTNVEQLIKRGLDKLRKDPQVRDFFDQPTAEVA